MTPRHEERKSSLGALGGLVSWWRLPPTSRASSAFGLPSSILPCAAARRGRGLGAFAGGPAVLFAAALAACGCGAVVPGVAARRWSGAAPAARPRSAPACGLEPLPSLSTGALFLPRFFMAVGAAWPAPVDSTLEPGTGWDVTISYDAAGPLTWELQCGSWRMDDAPDETTSASNSLAMLPVSAGIQLVREVERLRSRTYLVAGGGYSFETSYDVSDAYRQHAFTAYGVSPYDAEADDFGFWYVGAGVEMYSTFDAKLNLGAEVRYLSGTYEITESKATAPALSGERDLAAFVWRLYLSWHF